MYVNKFFSNVEVINIIIILFIILIIKCHISSPKRGKKSNHGKCNIPSSL